MGAGLSMAFSEALSDTGDVTGRGNPFVSGAITGDGTFLGGVIHTLPFLLPNYHAAIVAAVVVIGVELGVLAWRRYTQTSFARAFVSVAVGGAIVSALSAGLGVAAN